MGVHGLWKLIDSAGKPIPIETLENKVLAVDVSIWLYQLVKGFQERAGRAVNNPFLLGLFRRICKLLFYRIKPVFVFDGGVPSLKKKTIAARQRNRSKANEISESLKKTLLENLAKQHALGRILGEGNIEIPRILLPKEDTLFLLPPLPEKSNESDEDSDGSEEHVRHKYSKADLHSIDITSEDFLSLPADIRHDILTDLKETRKQNSWANVHLMPENSTDFSQFQMGRLLKRRAVQVGLETAEGEMGTRGFTIADIQDILKQQGVDTDGEIGQRIAADNTTRFLYASKDGGKAISNIRNIPTKKAKKSDDSKHFPKEMIVESDDEPCYSSMEEDDPLCLNISSDDLSQDVIFNMIKVDAVNKPGTSKSYDINLPSTSKIYHPSEIEQSSNSLEIDKNRENKETAIQEHVNDQHVEHGSEIGKDNEQLKLDHESLPRIDCRMTSSQKDSLWSNNHFIKKKDKADCKLLESSTSIKEVMISDKTAESTLTEDKTKEEKSTLINNEDKITSDRKDQTLKEVEEFNKEDEKEPLLLSSSVKGLSDSDSDDDFLEVDMNVGDDLNKSSTTNKTAEAESSFQTPALEILVNPKEIKNIEEEDIFADVFRSSHTPNNNETIDKVKDSIKTDIIESNSIINSKAMSDVQDELKSSNIVKSFDSIKSAIENKDNKKEPEAKVLEEIKADDDGKMEECKSSCESNKEEPSTNTAGNYFKEKQLNLEEIIKMKTNLEKESDLLVEETSREDRIAATISEQTTIEAQELLRLFGLPYIVAPMEAEAQCAFLDISGQTQGTITDDSDIWLFGANNVYKNFFNQKKFVKQFKASDIQRVYHLNRDDLIMVAMLTGSDYTSGIPGIGPVNALEIAAQFRPRDNSTAPDQRLSRFVNAYLSKRIDPQLAKKLKNLQFLEGFPSSEVVRAYVSPAIDDSTEPFSWAAPNLERLRLYTFDKFGWNKSQTDQILLPILDKLKENRVQRTMHNYFEWAFDGIENKMSRRVEKAVSILGGRINSSPQKPSTRVNSLIKPVTSTSSKMTTSKNLTNQSLPMKSKTPAQLAREKAAKKFQEIKRLEKEKKQQKSKSKKS